MKTAIILVVAAWAVAAVGGDGAPKTGKLTLEFTRSSPMAEVKSVLRRTDAELKPKPRGKYFYLLRDRSFQAYVPKSYQPWQPHGLIVWVASRDKGDVLPQYVSLMDKHKLIWIGANKAGSEADTIRERIPLALDAAHNMPNLYNIDPDRIYVVGIGSGAQVASQLAVQFADVFNGGAFLLAASFWEKINVPGQDQFWVPGIEKPRTVSMVIAKRRGRYVLLTGEDSDSRDQMKQFYEQGYNEELKNVLYLEVPKMGNELPPAEWFEKAVQHLDRPLRTAADDLLEKGRDAEKKRRYKTAMGYYFRAAAVGSKKGMERLQKHRQAITAGIAAAKVHIADKNIAAAVGELEKLLDRYGKDAAFEARVLLREIRQDPAFEKEKEAQEVLSRAKQFYKKRDRKNTFKYLELVVEKYPGTAAAREAEKVLTKLRK